MSNGSDNVQIALETKWVYNNVPEASVNYYKMTYLEVYRAAADYMNSGIVDELNKRFVKEVGTFDDYNNPIYNNWMAVHMTQALVESGVLNRHTYFRFVYYNSDLVLVCVRSNGASIRMEFVPGTEEILKEAE